MQAMGRLGAMQLLVQMPVLWRRGAMAPVVQILGTSAMGRLVAIPLLGQILEMPAMGRRGAMLPVVQIQGTSVWSYGTPARGGARRNVVRRHLLPPPLAMLQSTYFLSEIHWTSAPKGPGSESYAGQGFHAEGT